MSNRRLRYENLVKAHSTTLYRYAYWLTGRRDAAEDLVQDTFLRAWRFLDSLKSDGAAKSWLITILRRENARKYERKALDYDDVELDTLPDDEHDTMVIDPAIKGQFLYKIMATLPSKYREPLALQILEGYSLDEIAMICDLPRNTVATRLHRARQKLISTARKSNDIRDVLM